MVKTQKDWVIRSQAPNGFLFVSFGFFLFENKKKRKEEKKTTEKGSTTRRLWVYGVLTMSLRYSLFPF